MTDLLTIDPATKYMFIVELVPKNKRFSWRDATLGADGRGRVTIISNASTVTIAQWFEKASLRITQFAFDVRTGERVAYFKVIEPNEGENN